MHVCISKLGRHRLVQIMACLNQCWFIVKWTLRNKLQWNFSQNSSFFLKKMQLKISPAKWWPFCFGLRVSWSKYSEENWPCYKRTPLYNSILYQVTTKEHVDGLVQERCNSSALAMELRLSCPKPFDVSYFLINASSQQFVHEYFNSVALPEWCIYMCMRQ